MTGFTALLDANILYPAPMRDIFLQMAADDVFRAKWTEDIHREWIDALIRNEPHRDRAALSGGRGGQPVSRRGTALTRERIRSGCPARAWARASARPMRVFILARPRM